MMLVIRYALATFLLLLLWWAGSAAMGPDLLPDPWATAAAFITALGDPDFIRHGAMAPRRLVAGGGDAANNRGGGCGGASRRCCHWPGSGRARGSVL